MTAESSGAMSPETQIKCAIEEGMENIARAIFGENLSWQTAYKSMGPAIDGVEKFETSIRGVSQLSERYVVNAEITIAHPDAENFICRITDVPFKVQATDWASVFEYEAWCETNPYNGAMVIVRELSTDRRVHWLVAESMEGEVWYRGPYESLFPWAKEIVQERWTIVLAA